MNRSRHVRSFAYNITSCMDNCHAAKAAARPAAFAMLVLDTLAWPALCGVVLGLLVFFVCFV